MARWTLTYLNNIRSYNELYSWASTTIEDHLFMSWSHTMPARHAIWRVVRGKSVFCGYQYIWDTPIIVEQNESGDTIHHTFNIAYLEPEDHIWYYLHSPQLPSPYECQGPLIHIPPVEVHLWTDKMYVGTRSKGIFYTDSFSGPGGPPPIWQTVNGGLLSLHIVQLEPDPLGVAYRHYCIAGTTGSHVLYKRVPPVSPAWVPILTLAQALTLTGAADGRFRWVTTNINYPGLLYLLFSGHIAGQNRVWVLRSFDYGDTWWRDYIFLGNAYNAGCIKTGILQGSSPHPAGDVIYATINAGAGGRSYIFRSYDNGSTWTPGGYTGIMLAMHNVQVDPTDQAILYMGGFALAYWPRRLYRSVSHGGVWVNISDGDPLGIFISAYRANLWIDPAHHQFLRVLQDLHIQTNPNSGLTWDDWGATQIRVDGHTALWENPSRLYLWRSFSGSGPPPSPLNHVVFVSDTHGTYMEGKAGAHPYLSDGGGDSIPYNCGGVCLQGMMLFPPL